MPILKICQPRNSGVTLANPNADATAEATTSRSSSAAIPTTFALAAPGPRTARDALVSDQLGQLGRPPDLAVGLVGGQVLRRPHLYRYTLVSHLVRPHGSTAWSSPPSRSRPSIGPVSSETTLAGSMGRRCSIPWWAGVVVVIDELGQHLLQVPPAEDQQAVEHLPLAVRTQRSE